MLTALGLGLADETAEYWLLSVPSFRFDISIDADLLEEVARIYGYARLPTRISAFAVEVANISDSQTEKATLKRHLVSRNFQEIITYSFIDPKLHQTLFPLNLRFSCKIRSALIWQVCAPPCCQGL